MKLGEILARYSHVRLGSRRDNEAILNFLKEVPTNTGGITFRFERTPDYFRYLGYQSHRPFVFVFENKDRSIGGVASLCVRTCYIDGQPQSAVYMSDVRLSCRLSRATRLQWRSFYADLVRHAGELEEFEGARFMYTLVMDGNEGPVRAFGRGKSEVVYEPMATYDTVNILGRKPFLRDPLPAAAVARGFRARLAGEADVPRLRAFLQEQNEQKPLGHYFTQKTWATDGSATHADELQRRLHAWDGLDLASFVIVEDAQGRIQACACPWSFDGGRRLIVENMPRSLKALGFMLPFFGRPSVRNGKAMRVLNMTHLEVNSTLDAQVRQEAFALLLAFTWELPTTRGYHVLALADFRSESFGPALSRYIRQRSPATIYRVVHVDKNAQVPAGSLNPFQGLVPAFEIAIP